MAQSHVSSLVGQADGQASGPTWHLSGSRSPDFCLLVFQQVDICSDQLVPDNILSGGFSKL